MFDITISATAEAFLSSEAEAGRFRGSVLLSRNGHTLLRSGYGFANEEWRILNTPTTKFRIGSVTKMFTAAAVLRLVDDLNGTIDRWLDELPEAWRPITVHQLLTHTSGLRDHISVPAKRTMNLTGAKPAELAKLIASEPLLAPPGTAWAYSNTGYVLLGLLIEKISNRSYAEYLRDEVFQPLSMTLTGYDSASEILSERASGYSARDGHLVNAEYLNMGVPFSAGGLYSTVDDLLKWATSIPRAMTSEFPEAGKDDWHYGYGLFILKRAGYRCLAHDGGVNGFLAVFNYYPEIDASLIVLSNLLDPRAMQPVVDRLSTMITAL